MTLVQKITLALMALMICWELYVQFWWMKTLPPSGGGAVIRVDLVLSLPMLLILSIISLFQLYKNLKKKS